MKYSGKKLLLLFAVLLTTTAGNTQTTQINRMLPVNDKLVITASATSSENDFNFLEGKWKVQNRMLTQRLNNSREWVTFDAELHMRKALTGMGNIENYYATFNDKPFEGMAIRLFDKTTRLWTVYWVDSNGPAMDKHPVTGSFEKNVGKLYAQDTFNNKPVFVLYQWDATDADHPKWSQAFSPDNGKTWEWNWEMTLTKLE